MNFSRLPQRIDHTKCLQMVSSTSHCLGETKSTQQPKVLRPSWDTIPTIFATIQSYTSAIEWFYYLTFISHILCKSDSAHVANAGLGSFLRARPHIQMWHEALLSEMHDEDEPNLPSILESINSLHPLTRKFQQYCTQRASLMTKGDVFVARCVVVAFIYRHLDGAQAAADEAKNVQARKVLEEQGMAVQQCEQARKHFEASYVHFGSTVRETPSIGQIGVLDLAGLLAALSLQSPLELSITSVPVPVSTVAPTQESSWVHCLVHGLTQLAAEATPYCFHSTV
jgi:hypothetical protein